MRRLVLLSLLGVAGCGRIGFDDLITTERARGTISVGSLFACSIRDGTVWCWGDGGYGQLGNLSVARQYTPVAVADVAGATMVAAGTSHACAITENGEVWCWGYNGSKQLGGDRSATRGARPPTDYPDPKPVAGLPGPARYITSGAEFTCVLIDDGSVWCWGRNDLGQLGIGVFDVDSTGRTPARVAGITDAVQIAAGDDSACARSASGRVSCWGEEIAESPDTMSAMPVVVTGLVASDISLGASHACAIVEGGYACWGDNSSGQLGDGTYEGRLAPVPMALPGAVAIDGGHHSTCAVLTTGGLSCWGSGSTGELGSGTRTSTLVPGAVIELSTAVAVSVGTYSACAVSSDGAEWCWGDGSVGQVGDGRGSVPSPKKIGLAADLLAVDDDHSCAARGNTVWCWGRGSSGELGDGALLERWTPVAVQSSWSGTVTSLAIGDEFSCALTTDAGGTVWCWGHNGYGQLGDGSTTDRMLPVSVVTNATELVTGNRFACAIAGGQLQCWGSNEDGVVGSAVGASTSTPTNVAVPGATGLTAGTGHACVMAGTDVYCWGYNYHGQIGDGSPGSSVQTPVVVQTNASAVRAGWLGTCATVGASTSCWGYNNSGFQFLGVGAVDEVRTPATSTLAGLPLLGESLSCLDGACWGSNGSGRIGDGTFGDRYAATPITGLPASPSVLEVGSNHVCAIASGEVYCWGNSDYGQLGDGRPSTALVPVKVK